MINDILTIKAFSMYPKAVDYKNDDGSVTRRIGTVTLALGDSDIEFSAAIQCKTSATGKRKLVANLPHSGKESGYKQVFSTTTPDGTAELIRFRNHLAEGWAAWHSERGTTGATAVDESVGIEF